MYFVLIDLTKHTKLPSRPRFGYMNGLALWGFGSDHENRIRFEQALKIGSDGIRVLDQDYRFFFRKPFLDFLFIEPLSVNAKTFDLGEWESIGRDLRCGRGLATNHGHVSHLFFFAILGDRLAIDLNDDRNSNRVRDRNCLESCASGSTFLLSKSPDFFSSGFGLPSRFT